MTYDELFQMIRSKFRLVNRPSNNELQAVADKLIELSKTKRFVSDNDLLVIINTCVKDTTCYVQDSIDMTSSINIANQIIAKLKQ